MADPTGPKPGSSGEDPGLLKDVFQTRYREVTVAALVLGAILGVIMNAAITYAGLKIGFTIGGSAIAAVLGFGVLRGLMGRGTILETNITQTVASAVNTSNSGIIFTIPALYLLLNPRTGEVGYQFNFWAMLAATIAGAVLGVAFIIPTRKQMIDIERLRFPSAVAVGAILKSPGAGAKKSIVLVIGIVIAMLVYLPAALPSITFDAELTELDELVAREKISPAQADLTRRIAEWEASQTLPPELVEEGEAIAAQIEDYKAQRQAILAEGRTPSAEFIAEQVTEQNAPALPLMVYRVSIDEKTWDELRDRFWAQKPLWGYSDLNWRVPYEGPVGPDQELPREVDRDQNKRPDLLLTDTAVDVGRIVGLPAQIQFIIAIAPFAIGAGYLTGRAGLVVLAGGVLAYFVINPFAYADGWLPATLERWQVPGAALVTYNRPLGIGLLLGGAFMGIVAALPALRAVLSSLRAAATRPGGSDELGLKFLIGAIIVAFVVLFLAATFSIDTERSTTGLLSGMPSWAMSAIIAVIGTAWIWFAGIIIAQCTGMTDWSPISGLALLTVVLVMFLAGASQVVAAVLIGAALCTAITECADMMADLKTGFIVGAKPKRQQFVEVFASALGPAVTFGTIAIIVAVNLRQYGVALGPPTLTVAPQGQALAGVITAVQGGEVPYVLFGAGALLGALLGLGSFAGLGVLVGLSMYLPIMYILPYGVGCIINLIVARIKGRHWAEYWGIPLAAGLIVGEAILALIINIIVLAMG